MRKGSIRKVMISLLLASIFMVALSLASPVQGGSVNPDGALSPILGGWYLYRSDSVDNLASVIAYNSVRDEYLVVWEDHNPTEVAVYARRVAHDGSAIGGAIPVAHYSTYPSWQPAVAYSPAQDKYLVVYSQDVKPAQPPPNDTVYDIFGQPVNGDGTITETGFLIDGNTNHQRRPAIAYDSDFDEFLVVWDEEQGLGGLLDIWAQRINDVDWSFEPGPVCIATGDGLDRYDPAVAYNESREQFMIAYTRIEGDPDIFAKIVDAHLPDPLSVAEFALIYNTNLQEDVAVAAGFDEYMAVWQDGPSSSWRTIYARRVDGDGTMPDPPFLIADHSNEVCLKPDIAFGRGFGYLAVWSYESSAVTATDTYGRYIMRGQHEPAGLEFSIGSTLGIETDPAIGCAWSGDCLFAESDDGIGLDFDIYGRIIGLYRSYLPLLKGN